MGFDRSRQLRRQEDVVLSGRMVEVDQHASLSIQTVQGVVGVGAAWFALFCFTGGFAADVDDGVVVS